MGASDMMLHIAFLPAELRGVDLTGKVCIVLDIFRATTSITAAISNGCEVIYPVLTIEDARQLAENSPDCLLAGERRSLRIEGFHLGNSPYDFSPEVVRSRRVIMTTTNGTAAIKATEGCHATLIGSFLNAAAVCREAARYGEDILILCAGTELTFSLEDALCAGYLTELLQGENTDAELTDAAYAALLLYRQAAGDLPGAVKHSKNGRRLYELGRAADVEYCLRQNSVTVVPRYAKGSIREKSVSQ